MKNLVIVESPSKAKTIQRYLGDDFVVTSCMGHIRDLPGNDQAIDIANDFTPVYEITEDKKKLVSELKKMAAQAEYVWLASDEDREGEAIAWHLFEALQLRPERTKRIVFHEITKPAILNAVANPRTIDQALVDAQQARRVLDRLVGYGLSPVLWRKVQRNLSAGRVQSVAVRLVVEREQEIINFTSTSQFKVTAEFDVDGKTLTAELPKRFDTEEEARTFLERCQNATYTIANLETKPAKRSPAAPFTTSTLQQEASRKLGMSLQRTMKVAQDLYEAGLITYMRTDSTSLSDLAIEAALNEVTLTYGEKYSTPRTYATKVASAQEAHEAIRPTDFSRKSAGDTDAHRRLYELIWKRAIASQMADARLERTTATIAISTVSETLQATGEVLLFDGFLTVYMESSDDDQQDEDNAKMLPPLRIGQSLDFRFMQAQERYARPPARYTEASLVKKLEELGIGRPSTYAPTISTIQARNYVVKEDRDGRQRDVRVLTLNNHGIQRRVDVENTGAERNKLFPTDIGTVVTEFLTKNFDEILDYQFTANVEKQFDEIATGSKAWQDMIRSFYGPFKESIERVAENAERQSGERLLGVDPVSGKNVYVRLGRYGPLAQIGDADDEEKRQKGLPSALSINTITLEQALELFRFPRVIGMFEGAEMQVKLGRFGPYIEHAGAFYSLAKTDDPFTIEQERGIEVITTKRQATLERTIKVFDEDPSVKILKGRWGPYIVVGKQNVRIPKDTDATSLSLKDCLELAAQQAPDTKKASKTKASVEASVGSATGGKAAAAKKTSAKKVSSKRTAAKKAAKK
jgi:DNA topoisomerase-1